jgi:hypothetical protein
MVSLCQLKELDLSCFGCCGNHYSNKKKLMRDIKKNTLEFDNRKSTKDFMSRKKELRFSGVCANLILKDGKFFCPGHKAIHKTMDFRDIDKDCDQGYLCKTCYLFDSWDEEKQNKFIEFLKSKNMDSYAYSMRMDTDSLLEEFEKKLKNSGEKSSK